MRHEAPPSPDYVPSLEEPEQAPPLPKLVHEPVYLEFMPLEDEILPSEKQPLPAIDSPTADSPGYIPESNPEEDLTGYPVDGGDDDDDNDGSSDNDEDDDDDDDVKEDEEEKEHPASANSIPPPPVHRVTTRMSIREQPPTPVWSEAEIDRLLAIPSPLSLWASVAMLRVAAPSTYILAPRSETPSLGIPPHLRITLPTSSPPLLLPSTSHRADVLKVTLPPQKRLCIALGLRFEVGESSSSLTARLTGGFRVDYGFVATLNDEIRRDHEREIGYEITYTWDEMLVGMSGAPETNEIELGWRMTNFVTTVRHDTDEIYRRLDDAQDDRVLMSGQLNMLHRDKCDHARTARLLETEARLSRQAWVQSMDASDTAHAEELALMYARMFLKESDKIERYIGGLPDMIYGSVMESKPKTMQDVMSLG
nr:hypothetical protein [Tanacetum cinerariifolium]